MGQLCSCCTLRPLSEDPPRAIPGASCARSRVRVLKRFDTDGVSYVHDANHADSLEGAIAEFQRLAMKQGKAADPLAEAAFKIIQALLSGPQQHLQQVCADIVVCTGKEPEDVCSLIVKFEQGPLAAEVSTRTKLPFEVHFDKDLSFTVKKSSEDHLTVAVKGLTLVALPEIPPLRTRLWTELGHNYNASSVHRWWTQHRWKEYPLRTSKLHRIYWAVFGLRSANMLPYPQRIEHEQNAIFSYVNFTDVVVDAFNFRPDQELGARVTIQSRCSDENRIFQGLTFETVRRALASKVGRKAQEAFARSAMNFLALMWADTVEEPGADVDMIAKLFSAAEWWGFGSSGWQQFDATWKCIDQTDRFGKIIASQGRLFWRVVDAALDPDASTMQGVESKVHDWSYFSVLVFRALTNLVTFLVGLVALNQIWKIPIYMSL